MGAVVELSHKHFSPNYLFSSQGGIVSIYLHITGQGGASDFLVYYPTKKKGRALDPNVYQIQVVLRTIPVQVHLAFNSNPDVAQSSFDLLLIPFIFILFFLQFLIRWQ